MKDLVGLAGEIHGFRALQKFYGVETGGRAVGFQRTVDTKYPENTTDDGYGCENPQKWKNALRGGEGNPGRRWRHLSLVLSEVELAIDSSNRRKKSS